MSKDRQRTYKYKGRDLTVSGGGLGGDVRDQFNPFLTVQDLRHRRSEVTVELRRVSGRIEEVMSHLSHVIHKTLN